MQENIYNSSEQKTHRAAFVRTGGVLTSTPCPACCDHLVGTGKKIRGWLRGNVGEGTCAVECNNCGYIRVSKARAKTEGQTPSQLRAVNRINQFFSGKQFDKSVPLHEWSIKPDGRGGIWVSVKTTESMWTCRGGYFHIGVYGVIECVVVYALCSTKEITEETKAHYNKMLAKW